MLYFVESELHIFHNLSCDPSHFLWLENKYFSLQYVDKLPQIFKGKPSDGGANVII